MKFSARASFLLFAILIDCLAPAGVYSEVPPQAPQKKLIEFGWDMPNSFYVQQHIQEMEKLPFDGIVLSARYRDELGQERLFHDDAFGMKSLRWETLAPAAFAAADTPFVRFSDNFLRLNVTPADFDWFDDLSPLIHNCRMAGRIVQRGKLKGLLFDLEQYGVHLFEYPRLKLHGVKSFSQYQQQIRAQGEAVVRAIQDEAPDLTIFLPISYDQSVPQTGGLQEWKYGLLAAFLDGLFSGARGNTVIVDGFEASYGYSKESQFAAAYRQIHEGNKKLTLVPAHYAQRISAAFGLWMDYDSHRRPWKSTDFSTHFFSPEQFSLTVASALQRSDRYVWIYTELPKWWTSEQLPAAYVTALERARQGIQP